MKCRKCGVEMPVIRSFYGGASVISACATCPQQIGMSGFSLHDPRTIKGRIWYWLGFWGRMLGRNR